MVAKLKMQFARLVLLGVATLGLGCSKALGLDRWEFEDPAEPKALESAEPNEPNPGKAPGTSDGGSGSSPSETEVETPIPPPILSPEHRRDAILMFSRGDWRSLNLADGSTETFHFGQDGDVPLLQDQVVGHIAVYGGDPSTPGRFGSFVLDRNANLQEDADDSVVRFMNPPEVVDLPILLDVTTRRKVDGDCMAGDRSTVVAVKRLSTWHVDMDGSGTFSPPPYGCDASFAFGQPDDIPVVFGEVIGVARRIDQFTYWIWDNNRSLNEDVTDRLIVFGGSSDFVPTGVRSTLVGRDRSVFVDRNGDGMWITGMDLDVPDVLPDTSWQVVGWTHRTNQ